VIDFSKVLEVFNFDISYTPLFMALNLKAIIYN